MRLFQAADVIQLTELTRSQLREWTGRGRRDLVPADVEPMGPGRHALYTWQTVLVLRVLRTLHIEFAVEVGAWAPAINEFRRKLDGVSFPALWNTVVYFPDRQHAELIGTEAAIGGADGIAIALYPHVILIATKLSIVPPDQLPLFPAVAVSP